MKIVKVRVECRKKGFSRWKAKKYFRECNEREEWRTKEKRMKNEESSLKQKDKRNGHNHFEWFLPTFSVLALLEFSPSTSFSIALYLYMRCAKYKGLSSSTTCYFLKKQLRVFDLLFKVINVIFYSLFCHGKKFCKNLKQNTSNFYF